MKARASMNFVFEAEGVVDDFEPEDLDKRIEEYKSDVEALLIKELADGCDKAAVRNFNISVEPVEKSDDSERNN